MASVKFVCEGHRFKVKVREQKVRKSLFTQLRKTSIDDREAKLRAA